MPPAAGVPQIHYTERLGTRCNLFNNPPPAQGPLHVASLTFRSCYRPAGGGPYADGVPALPPRTPTSRPPALVVAAALLAVQSLAALVYAVVEVGQVRSSRPVVGVGVTLIMLGYAVLLAAVARGVLRSRRWSRGLAVVTQLILLLLGWSFRESPTTAVGVTFGLVAATALVCLVLPASTRAFLDTS